MEKKVRNRIFKFLLGFLVLHGLAYGYFTLVSSKNFAVIKADRKFWKNYDDQQILVLGHSRVQHGIEPNTLEDAISAATSGETVIKTYYKLKHILAKAKTPPKLIIVPGGEEFFVVDKAAYEMKSFFWRRYYDYWEMAEESGDYKHYVQQAAKAYGMPYHKYPFMMLMRVNGELQTRKVPPYATLSESERLASAEEVVQQHGVLRDYKDDLSKVYTKKMIQLAKDYDCHLLFIRFPVAPEYRTMSKQMLEQVGRDRDRTLKMIQGLNHTTFMDAGALIDDCPECFEDTHHLNEHGKARFTDELIGFIKEKDLLR